MLPFIETNLGKMEVGYEKRNQENDNCSRMEDIANYVIRIDIKYKRR